MRGLIIAEKPSVMRAIQEVIKSEKIKDLDCAAFHGHLMGLKEPQEYDPRYSDWHDTSLMPIIPANIEYKAVDGKSVSALLQKIKTGGYDYLVNACDAGREGEHIFWSFYETVGLTLPVKRFWTSSVTKPALKTALANLQDASKYDGMRQAAKYRAQLDWLVGMNFTRAATHQLGTLNSIGRVQTPTVKLIVDRELEIQNFKPEDFCEVKGVFGINGSEVEAIHLIAPELKETRFKEASKAEAIVKDVKAKTPGTVSDVTHEEKTVPAATLYSLAELQKAANSMFGFRPDKTLAIAQKLYEEGVLSYPRTESRALPTDMIPELKAHLLPVKEVPELAQYVDRIGQAEIGEMLKGKYVDDNGITDHHAIIPTDQTPNWAGMSKDEQSIYEIVAKSFLAIFMPPYKFSTTTVTIDVGGNIFKAQGKVDIDKGYTILYPSGKKKEEPVLPACKTGDKADAVKVAVSKGTTKPPKRYTPRTILAAMQNAGQTLSDSEMRSVLREASGLGTSATRADILKKIEDREYVQVKGNQYYALPGGMTLIKNIGDRSFASASLTAEWEKKLMDMEKGKYTGDFRAEMEAYIRTETAHILDSVKGIYGTVVGKCPRCGGDIKDFGRFYCCENRRKDDPNSCSVGFNKVLLGHELSEQDIQNLLSGNGIGPYEFVSKDKKKFKACAALNKETGELDFEYANEVVGKCPCCGGAVKDHGEYYSCENRKKDDPNSCKVIFNKIVSGYELSKQDIQSLLSETSIGPVELISKDKRKFKARIILNKETGGLNYEYENEVVGQCPNCGGEVRDYGEFYCCENRKKDDPNSCSVGFNKVFLGHKMSKQDVQDLLSKNSIGPYEFMSKDKKKFTARLVFDKVTGRLAFERANESLGKCPCCGGDVIEVGKGYICSKSKKDDPDACHFGIPHTVGGVKFSKEDLAILLSGGTTSAREIKTKTGKPWKVKFKLDENWKLIPIDAEEKKAVGKCPCCGGVVIGTSSNFYCSNKGCDWSFSRQIKGATLSDKDMQDLLAGQHTRDITFLWNNGSRGKARLYLRNGKLQWDFDK